jgi:hypothetical protein
MQEDDTPGATDDPRREPGDKKLGRVAIKRVKLKRADIEQRRRRRRIR